MDEDEQLRQAIAMSMAEAANQQTAAAPSRKAVVDLDSGMAGPRTADGK